MCCFAAFIVGLTAFRAPLNVAVGLRKDANFDVEVDQQRLDRLYLLTWSFS
jgi:hypothetical protein